MLPAAAAKWAPAELASAPRGVEGESLRMVPAATVGLVALVGEVGEEAYGEEVLNASIADLTWLEPRARAHQAVVAWAFERAEAIVPLRFGTIFRGDARVREGLLEHGSETLQRSLRELAGRREWGVTMTRVGPAVHEPEEAAGEDAGLGAGASYLARRKREQSRATASAGAAEDTLSALSGLSERVDRVALPRGPILRAAFLLLREGEEAWMAEAVSRARVLEASGLRLEVTGPWPPYSFAGRRLE